MLAVGDGDPYPGMTEERRQLRRRLRAHGRQLGDRRNGRTREQEIDRLVHETAYEHWHRMLFARFLAENELLVEPESGVPVSLAECEELARERGEDPWEAAGRWASEMLPEIFRPDDPVLALQLPPETRQALRQLLSGLPPAVFTADDSLGWTYQYWQAERKDAVNKSGVKIGADELPAVTQLFTERYMVLFLLHNTVGAWRAGRVLAKNPELARTAETEDELRNAVRLRAGNGYDFDYLRFVREARDGDERQPADLWRPAVGSFELWPRMAAELRVLDPCCGSGHFLVETFHLLVRLRMEEESLAVADAIRAVLRDNLFGLELDPRCTQIAAFNVALAAWKMAGDHISLPPLEIACSGLGPHSTRDEWLDLADAVAAAEGLAPDRDLLGTDDNLLSAAVRQSVGELHALFEQAPVLGSLIDPRAASDQGDVFQSDFASLRPLLRGILAREVPDADIAERAVAARGMAHAAKLLGDTYTLVVTNVPYLARAKQSQRLRRFCESRHGDAKGDLSTAFVSRIFSWLGKHGTSATVTPQNWLFLKTYQDFRRNMLEQRTLHLVARLGPGAFETIGGHVVSPTLSIVSAPVAAPSSAMVGLTVAASCGQHDIKARDKARLLTGDGSATRSTSRAVNQPSSLGQLFNIRQTSLTIGAYVIVLDQHASDNPRVHRYARAWQGLVTGDDARFLRRHWEQPQVDCKWTGLQRAPQVPAFFGGRDTVIYWQGGRGELHEWPGAHNFPPPSVLGRSGVAIQQMNNLQATIYTGDIFGPTVAPLILHRDNGTVSLPALWSFCDSESFCNSVRSVNPKVNVTPGSFGDIPFDDEHWMLVAKQRYPNGLPEPYSDDPTQWIFHGDPCGSVVWDEETKRTAGGPLRTDHTVLQIAVARLLGYRWPAELDTDMRLSKQQRELVESCPKLESFADADGIVCLSPTHGEASAADRLRSLLAVAYDDRWSPSTERALLAATAEKPPTSLEAWLRDRFFQEHCRLFDKRPFIWHIWDGRKDGFHALVNYHRLAGPDGEGRRTLETLAYSYVHDWIDRQRQAQRDGVAGADARLVAALDLQEQLQRILTGEPPHDIFVRWRSLAEQPLGWSPHLDDGVRLNIRPFMRAGLRSGGRKGAGILCSKPNIKWTKDRGKEPRELRDREEYPWFWSCPGTGTVDQRTDYRADADARFDGNRWNDLHYTLAAKRAAQEAAAVVRRTEKAGA